VTKRIRVVLVDDHDMVLRLLVAAMAAQPDFDVVGSAMTIADALMVTAASDPDVVVIDYTLPDGDGAEGARRLRQATPDLRVIMLTGRDDEATRKAAFDAGCCGFVAKGARLDELAVAVRAAVNPD
jgi:DNA-binding NarL/FixJ family response regulator